MNKLNIWIDVTNSPHVLFFRPIIKELINQGHKVTVTSRDFSQTIDLLSNFKIKHTSFGKYGGKDIFNKGFNLIKRSYQLYKFAKNKNFDLALSHNSVDICVVSKILGIPVIDIFDYEYAQFHNINFRCSTKIMCPEYISNKDIIKYGGRKEKIIKYNGLKEQMYFFDYVFDEKILTKLKIDEKKIIVVFRPPAESSLYHKGTKNRIYLDLIDFLGSKKNTFVVYLGRNKDQIKLIKEKKYKNFLVPEKAIDAPSLIKKSDIVISAGGTMNREAVALGTPVYTIFALKMGGVDRYLIKKGYLRELKKVNDVLVIKKRTKKPLDLINPKIFVNIFLKFVKKK